MIEAPRGVRVGLRCLACAYLAGVWLDGTGCTLPSSVLPLAANYFLQVAALFPSAAVASIDYRAEAWVCADRKWEELDTRPYFPIEPDDKENRFQRVMHFFRENRPTMHSLDAYLIERHRAGGYDDGIASDRSIGGVRLLSLRIPIPRPGEVLERPTRKPLALYPEGERHIFYHTPHSKIAERCGVRDEGGD
jgi:hypothetical protein